MQRRRLVIFVVLTFLLMALCAPAAQAQAALSADEAAVVAAVNQARQAAGLQALAVNPALCDLAAVHARDMVDKHYFGYRSPAFGSVFDLADQRHISFSRGGESIARLSSRDAAIRAWTSPSALAMKSYFNQIGVEIRGNIYVAVLINGSLAGTVQPPQVSQPNLQPKPQPQPQPQPAPPAGNVSLTADEARMLALVNQERTSRGLKPLVADPELVKLARMKAADMVRLGYFDHNSPTYGSPFDMMRAYGVSYRYAGENLAGASTVDAAHTNLMNSPGHRANILSPNYTRVGIGVVQGSPYGKIWVQMFTG